MSLINIRTIVHTYVYLVILASLSLFTYKLPEADAAPSVNQRHPLDVKYEFEQALDNFLSTYYEELLAKHIEESKKSGVFEKQNYSIGTKHGRSVEQTTKDEPLSRADVENVKKADIHDHMQGDQPVNEGEIRLNYNDDSRNMTDDVIKTRERLRKENWVEYLKSQILSQLGRSNSTTFTKPPEDPSLTDFNITQIIPKILNTTWLDDDQITEKIRSFYPSCEVPQNQDQEHSEDMMHLYFDFDYSTDNKNSNIASATLRLYRLPQNNTSRLDSSKDDCKNSESVEEDKLLRVSVYWYTKFQKKRRVKRRLSDSKVVPETYRWVELSVKPATKAWSRAGTKNLGLGILVEDQEGKSLRADKYFKGASCTVGVSTPKPIPTIVRDASYTQADELDRIHSLLGRNSTSTVYSDLLLLPTVDICYLEFPENTDISQFNSARINACNLRKIHEETQRRVEKERLERLATLNLPSARHIRHQRQHRQSKLSAGDLASLRMEDLSKIEANGRQMSELESSMRSSISNKQIVFTREELEEFQRDRGLKR